MIWLIVVLTLGLSLLFWSAVGILRFLDENRANGHGPPSRAGGKRPGGAPGGIPDRGDVAALIAA
ncbi:hypothetical protein AB0M20_31015, partial [Actinoplanes sp. NPDC051633]|uniref:hypothetical protein n=1 Tax=Actinoplanes sp. NPDC051633 TaxID=3155670 RepID=UPI0034267456